jgi:hypothetical protein
MPRIQVEGHEGMIFSSAAGNNILIIFFPKRIDAHHHWRRHCCHHYHHSRLSCQGDWVEMSAEQSPPWQCHIVPMLRTVNGFSLLFMSCGGPWLLYPSLGWQGKCVYDLLPSSLAFVCLCPISRKIEFVVDSMRYPTYIYSSDHETSVHGSK